MSWPSVAVLAVLLTSTVFGCNLEQFFNGKQVSLEENASRARVVFRGLMSATTSPSPNDVGGVFTANFDLVNTYKDAEDVEAWNVNNFRKVNVTFYDHPQTECLSSGDIPREYIVFCAVVGTELRAISVAKWDESADQRVWAALGWNEWSDWSACSASCSAGIQQRIRHCRVPECPGFNVEQRHCNLFGCGVTVNPLEMNDSRFFHPSKEKWQRVPERPSAWRLTASSYIWVPSAELFNDEKTPYFPRQFVLFVTLRSQNSTMGTIFSLRSRKHDDSYLSLELAGSDLKLIHVGTNGTDTIKIPTTLGDGKWHQISISVRDDSVVESYIDCEWSRTDVLKRDSLDIPEDSDLIIGYLFSGDIEQLSIVSDPTMVSLQCSPVRIPIVDPSVENEDEIHNHQREFKMDRRKQIKHLDFN